MQSLSPQEVGYGTFARYAPRMNRFHTRVLVALLALAAFGGGVFLGRSGSTPGAPEALPKRSEAQASASASATDPTVYITRTGTKYHRAGCRHLKSSIEKKLSEVHGVYGPCSVCNPPH